MSRKNKTVNTYVITNYLPIRVVGYGVGLRIDVGVGTRVGTKVTLIGVGVGIDGGQQRFPCRKYPDLHVNLPYAPVFVGSIHLA